MTTKQQSEILRVVYPERQSKILAALRMTANGLRMTAWKYTGIEHT